MKKLYYFSEEKTQFVEIKNLKSKFIILFPTLIISLTLLIIGGDESSKLITRKSMIL